MKIGLINITCAYSKSIVIDIHYNHWKEHAIITPHTCARDKVIGRVVVVIVVVVVVSTKIAISQDVGVYATRKHNESIEFS